MYSKIIQTNNQAAAQLAAAGCPEAAKTATKSLIEALEEVKCLLDVLVEQKRNVHTPTTYCLDDCFPGLVSTEESDEVVQQQEEETFRASKQPQQHEDSDDDEEEEEPSFSVCSYPASLPSDQMMEGTYSNGVFLSVVTMYNLALAFQLSRVAADRSKALNLYQVAYTLLVEEHLEEDAMVISLSIINNTAILYSKLGRPNCAHKCFQQLLSTVMFLTDQRYTRFSTELFLKNTSHLIVANNKNNGTPSSGGGKRNVPTAPAA